MSKLIVPIILAGGQGTRLWPLSRAARPKQFLALTGERSQFQQTLERVGDTTIYGPALVMTNADYRFIVAEQAAEMAAPLAGILLEPVTRDTAMAIATAAAFVGRHIGAHAILHILPSDHQIDCDAGYHLAIRQAQAAAASGRLTAFGLQPTHAETGYGYIKSPGRIGAGASPIECFVEKPDAERAGQMLAEGGYLWNSGMFMFSAAAFLQECEALAPEIAIAARAAVADAVIDPDFVRLDRTAFAAAPSISVDYAIFEKTARSAVVPVSFHWSDLGSWDGLWKVSPRDLANNAVRGAVTLHRVSNSLVLSDHAHIAVDGLDDIAVIATPDAIYVGRLSGASDIGVIVKTLRGGRETVDLTRIHETIRHPRGGHAATRPGERFQVKRLIVKPGRKPGLRKPRRRGLHWVVMRGTAEVTLNGTLTRLGKNQSIHLPPGCSHRLANPGRTDLELIEIETGSS